MDCEASLCNRELAAAPTPPRPLSKEPSGRSAAERRRAAPSGAERHRGETSGAEGSRAEPSGAEGSRAAPRGAERSRAEPSGAERSGGERVEPNRAAIAPSGASDLETLSDLGVCVSLARAVIICLASTHDVVGQPHLCRRRSPGSDRVPGVGGGGAGRRWRAHRHETVAAQPAAALGAIFVASGAVNAHRRLIAASVDLPP